MNLAQIIDRRTLHVSPDLVKLALLEPPGPFTLAELLRIHLASIRVHERGAALKTTWPRLAA